MLFQIRNIPTEIDVTSVILSYNTREADFNNLILWHCPICNQPLFQYTGKVLMIVPGMTPATSPPILIACARCKHKYLVNSIASDKI